MVGVPGAGRRLGALLVLAALVLAPPISSSRDLTQVTTLTGGSQSNGGCDCNRASCGCSRSQRSHSPGRPPAGRAIVILGERPGQPDTTCGVVRRRRRRSRPPARALLRCAPAPHGACARRLTTCASPACPAGTCRFCWTAGSACRCKSPTRGRSRPSPPGSAWRSPAPGGPQLRRRPLQPAGLQPAASLRRLLPPASPPWSPRVRRPG